MNTPFYQTCDQTNMDKYPSIEKKHKNILNTNQNSLKTFYKISNKKPLNSADQSEKKLKSVTQYDKKALAIFRKIDYVNGLKGHTEYTSANVLRNSIKTAINLDSNYLRFKSEINGG